MAAELEIVFVDRDGNGSEASDVAPQPIDTSAVGAPVGGHGTAIDQSAAKLSPDAPTRTDFQDLTQGLRNLAKSILGRPIEAPKLLPTPTLPASIPGSSTTGAPTRDETLRAINAMADRINGVVQSGSDAAESIPAADQAERPPQATGAPTGPDPKNQSKAWETTTERAPGGARDKAVERQKGLADRINNPKPKDPEEQPSTLMGRLGAELRGMLMRTRGGRAVGGAATRAARVAGPSMAGGAVAGGASTGAASSSAGAAAALAPLAVSVAAVVAGFAALAYGAKKVVDTFGGLENKIADISGPVAAARARNEVARELRRVALAQRIGPRVAQVTAARGRLEESVGRLVDSLADDFARLAPLVETGVDGITLMVDIVNAQKQAIDILIAVLTGGDVAKEFQEAVESAKRIADAFDEVLNTMQKDGQMVDPALVKLLDLDIKAMQKIPLMPQGRP